MAMVERGSSSWQSLKTPQRGHRLHFFYNTPAQIPIMWNLATYCRSPSGKAQFDLQCWITELTGTSMPVSPWSGKLEHLEIFMKEKFRQMIKADSAQGPIHFILGITKPNAALRAGVGSERF
jgi:hypothetical protein